MSKLGYTAWEPLDAIVYLRRVYLHKSRTALVIELGSFATHDERAMNLVDNCSYVLSRLSARDAEDWDL